MALLLLRHKPFDIVAEVGVLACLDWYGFREGSDFGFCMTRKYSVIAMLVSGENGCLIFIEHAYYEQVIHPPIGSSSFSNLDEKETYWI
ncbi:hypothetical protein H5410_028685 [Solanum commersonii]|uniref:Uncharacterized protein n=1 Tax=Solanum commersonii TaxID=4109 RepID=A0A9J5Z2T5_SOLCO|nr:hypothetical protein H5410_028685 [Solanum commersonii]